ncbi:MAG: hypothetical protein ACYCSB_09470 [bacterium]
MCYTYYRKAKSLSTRGGDARRAGITSGRGIEMIGYIIFFIIFGSIFIFLGIALIRSMIIQKREHPYHYCEYPRRKQDLINPSTGFTLIGKSGMDVSGTSIGDISS